MFTLIKWVAGAGVIVWLATTYGPMLGLPAGLVQQISATLDNATATVATPEQKAQADAALKQVAPSPEQLQAQATQLLPLAVEKLQEGKAAIQDAAIQMREGMKQP